MSDDPLRRLTGLLSDAATIARALSYDGLLERASALMERAPAEDREGLLEIVAAEVETCVMRRRGSPLVDDGRMYVNPTARVYTRSHDDDDPEDALARHAVQGAIAGLPRLVQRLVGAPQRAPSRLLAASAVLPPEQRHRALMLARKLLAAVEPGTPT